MLWRVAVAAGLMLALSLAAWASRSPRAVATGLDSPELRITWSGGAAAVAVIGEWDGWMNPVPLVHSRGIIHAAVVQLPAECPRAQLVARQVCCYRYGFRLGRTPAEAARASSLRADPSQPTDVGTQGRATNIACVSAAVPHGPAPTLQTAPASRPAGVGPSAPVAGLNNDSAVARAREEGKPLPCVQLASSRWDAAGPAPLQAVPAPSWAHCCDACVRRDGCAGFNWRPRATPNGMCELLQRGALGRLRATVFSSAGLTRGALPSVAAAAAGESAS